MIKRGILIGYLSSYEFSLMEHQNGPVTNQFHLIVFLQKKGKDCV